MAVWNLTTPLSKADILKVHIGDIVNLSGIIYSCRDTAHKKMIATLETGQALPFNIEGQIIYYMGPSPTLPGFSIGSCGPTTSTRMDLYATKLYSLGLAATIGKGKRGKIVCQAMKEHTNLYFLATGGAGALYSQCVKDVKIIAYEELGPEAIRQLYVENMPLLVANDSYGKELFAIPDITAALS